MMQSKIQKNRFRISQAKKEESMLILNGVVDVSKNQDAKYIFNNKLYKRPCPNVGSSVCLSVCLSVLIESETVRTRIYLCLSATKV